MTIPAKRAPGRPAKHAAERKRNNVTMRLRDETKDALVRSAAENQRSLSEEIESRVEQSFRTEDVLALVRQAVTESKNNHALVVAGLVTAFRWSAQRHKRGFRWRHGDRDAHEKLVAAIRALGLDATTIKPSAEDAWKLAGIEESIDRSR